MPRVHEGGPALLPTASEPKYLFSLQELPIPTIIRAFAQALVAADPAFVVMVFVSWRLM